MRHLFLDFETRSELNVGGPTGVGSFAYAEHPSTEVMCLAWALDDDEIELWTPEHDYDPVASESPSADWKRLIQRDDVVVVAHNIEFERSILKAKFGIDVPLRRWRDTAAMAARCSLPRKLEEAAAALQLPFQKDVEGGRVMKKLSRPRKASRDNQELYWTPQSKPDDFEKLYSYCIDDVAVERALFKALPPLSEREFAIWQQTLLSNERGVKVDLANIARAAALAKQTEQQLVQRFTLLTGASPRASKKAAAALGLVNMTKHTVRSTLKRNGVDDRTREALEIRQQQGKSSLGKLAAFQRRTSDDGRLRGSLIYAGAERTLRWSGSGVQLQNIPAPKTIKLDAAFAALEAGVFDLVYDDVLGALSEMLRGFLVGPFLIGDLAQIEARGVAWLAGEQPMLDAFARKEDLYKQMASTIYAKPVEAIVKAEREIGKRVILGCGYGMGPDKFCRTLDEQFGLKVAPDLAERAVAAYRRKYWHVPKFWYAFGDAFEKAVRTGAARIEVNERVSVGMTKIGGHPFAYTLLPSKRALFYGWPEVKDGRVRYFGRNQYAAGRWELVDTWGGKLTENATQAAARDVIADIMLRLEAAGFPVYFTVHDEVVCAGTAEQLSTFQHVFSQAPSWAAGLPVAAECFAAGRYKK